MSPGEARNSRHAFPARIASSTVVIVWAPPPGPRPRPPEVGRRSAFRLGDAVGDGSGVAGDAGWGVVELLGQVGQGPGQAGAVGAVEGDDDRVLGVVDDPALVEQVA